MEIVVVMIVFFIMLSMGIIFFTQYAQGEANKAVTEVDRANMAETAKIVSSLPELHCSLANDQGLACIDTLKAKEFALLLDDKERLHYSNLFYGFKAEADCIYSCDGIGSPQLFDYTGAGTSSQRFYIPSAICDPELKRCGYGEVVITQTR